MLGSSVAIRKGKASSAIGSASEKRSPIMLNWSASGERNHPFSRGNTGLPNSRVSSANHGPANRPTATAPPNAYAKHARRPQATASPGMASVNGSAAAAETAFEYL